MRSRRRSGPTLAAAVAVVALCAALTATATAGLPRDKSMPLVVVDDGVAPEGSRYQHILYHTVFRYEAGGEKQTVTAWCKELRFLGTPKRGNGGQCDGDTGEQPSPSSLPSVGGFVPSLVTPGDAGSDVYLAGNTSSRVDRVRVVYRDPSGRLQDLKVHFAKLDRARLANIGKRVHAQSRKSTRPAQGRRHVRRALRSLATVRPYGVFTAFLSGDVALRDGLIPQAKGGERGDPNQLGHDLVKTGNLGGLTWDGDECDEWSGPFKVIVYDANGQELEQSRCQR
jgi:hypothetical protein